MSDAASTYDPRNLIREAYRIERITLADCRSIFLDWALGLKDGQDGASGAAALLAHYSDQPEDHPMTIVLREAASGSARARRRGGAAGRR
jgi:hypothetical protein